MDSREQQVWARTGRELFFRSLDEQMMAVEVRTSPTFSERALFSLNGFHNVPGWPM